jgi:large subunit ribosomal protein L20
MVRITNSVASRARTKKALRKAKGFRGDRKNHHKLSKVAVTSALSFNYEHRKKRKRDFRSLWITRIGIAAKLHGLSYSLFMNGLKKIGCTLNRKVLSNLAISDPFAFQAIAQQVKAA